MTIDIHPSGYFALVLHRPSQERLLARYASLPFRIGHHCTVAYGTDRVGDLPPAFKPGDLGKEFQLRVTGYAIRADRGIESVAVELIDDEGNPIPSPFSTNRVPHVTLATDGNTLPYASNALLEEGFAPTEGPVLSCTLMHVRAQDETIRSHPEICMAGDDVLRRIADPLAADEITSAATRKLISRMQRILRESNGVGLAAPQIGVSKRVICVEVKKVKRSLYDPAQFAAMERDAVPFTVLINPVCVEASTEQRVFFEWCMSANAYYAAVPRSRFLTLDYFDPNGMKQRLHARGWLARILLHEMDHLDGVLCLDRMIPRTLVTRVSFEAHWSRLPAGEVLQRFGASWEPPTEHQE
jgi:peptide deformylase